MAPITGAEFAAVVRTADPETVAGFVADLYEARDRTVDREAGAGDAGAAAFVLAGETCERVVVPADGTVPAGADAVVVGDRTVDAPDGTRVIDADRLRDALCYAVDRETADRLLDRWFGRSLSSFYGTGAPSVGGTDDPSTDDRRTPADGSTPAGSAHSTPPPDGETDESSETGEDGEGDDGPETASAGRRPAAFAAVALAALLLAAAVVGLAVGLPPGFAPEPPANATGTATPVPDQAVNAGAMEPDPSGGFGTARAPGSGTEQTLSPQLTQLPNFMSPFPPGVDGTGITGYQRLVDANREQLSGTSYRLSVVYREFVDGETTGVSIQIVQVENATHYRASTMQFGRFESARPQLSDGDVYANGTVRFERTADGVRRTPVTASDPFLARLSRYLGWYLSIEESWIADRESGRRTTTLRIASEGDPWPGVTNATGDAIVTDDGLVRVLRRAYDEPDSGVRVVVTVRVSHVGRTVATRPPWMTDASA